MTAELIPFSDYAHRITEGWRRAHDATVVIMPMLGKYELQRVERPRANQSRMEATHGST
jgi:hypothetical protein